MPKFVMPLLFILAGIPNPSLVEMCHIISSALASITPSVKKTSYQMTMLSLPTDGSQDTLHGSRNLKVAIQAADESLLPDGRNDDEFFQRTSAVVDGADRKDENSDIFSADQTPTNLPKKKQKQAPPFKCDLCGKKYAWKYYKNAKSHREECPAQAASGIQMESSQQVTPYRIWLYVSILFARHYCYWLWLKDSCMHSGELLEEIIKFDEDNKYFRKYSQDFLLSDSVH